MPDSGSVTEERLPAAFEEVLAAYERHLTVQRDLSAHTVRAYRTDLMGLLVHLNRLGIDNLGDVDLRALRSWLAKQQTLGQARTTLQRRAAAIRVFFAWAVESGRIPASPAAALKSPKTVRALPPTLERADAAQMLDQAIAAAQESGGPVAARDVAILELLYATGIRVSELCGLDLGDLDRDRRVVRVFGKGRKERSVPVGNPAVRAVDAWVAQGRGRLATRESGQALFVGERGPAARSTRRPPDRPPGPAARRRGTRSRAARPAARHGHPSARRWGRSAQRAGDARPRLARDHPDLYPRHQRAAAHGIRAGASAGLTVGAPFALRLRARVRQNQDMGFTILPFSQTIRWRWHPVE